MPSSESDQPATFEAIPVTREDILNCSYSNWYDKFSKYTFSEAIVLKPLPETFVDYLLSDDIVLPKESNVGVEISTDNDYSDWEDDPNAQVTSSKQDPTAEFKEFHEKVSRAIEKLGGSVAPKLNWSCPQDATWMMAGNTMKCASPSDIYLLLKSSDYVNHDLSRAFECVDDEEQGPFPHELVLRKWSSFNPAMEFRCFVRDRELIAICQRDLNYYKFMEDIEDEVVEKIGFFFDDILLAKFDSNSFVFDVYIPRPMTRVYLVDVNPFARQTDPLLFTWHELATMPVDDTKFRMVEEANSGRFASKAHSQNQVPKEFVEASGDTGALVELAQRWRQMMDKEQDSDSSDE